jgi:hypothetical protein
LKLSKKVNSARFLHVHSCRSTQQEMIMNAFSQARLTVAGIVIFVTAGFTGQVSAVPFTYSYLAGFVDGSEVTSGGGLVFQLPTAAGAPQAGDVIEGTPLPGNTFRQIRWVGGQAVQSRLTVTNTGDDEAPQPLPENGDLVQLANVEHENNVIPQSFNYTVGFAASLRIFDQATQQLLFSDLVSITFKESLNAEPCVPPVNPTGSPVPCDDSFQLSGLSLAPLFFNDLAGDTWQVNFTLGDFVNAAFDPLTFTVFTAEATTSSLNLLMNIEQVNENPEPGPLLLIGLGLLSLGLTRWRGKRTTQSEWS